jgi:hypothetical protein
MAGREQLKASGIQDVYFTDNPEFSYFTKKHNYFENFERFQTSLDFDGNIDFGNQIRCTIPQDTGHFLKTASLKINLNPLDNDIQGLLQRIPDKYEHLMYNESIGHAMIEYVELIIGGDVVQRIPSDYFEIYAENFTTQTHQKSLRQLVGRPETFNPILEVSPHPNAPVRSIAEHLKTKSLSELSLFVDIPFYFHNNPELAIPLHAIKYHEVEIVVKLRDVRDCIYAGKKTTGLPSVTWEMFYTGLEPKNLIKNMKLSLEMIQTDAPTQHARTDYVITQIQENKFDMGLTDEYSCRLDFINPVKELFFVIQKKNEREVYSNNFVSVFDYDYGTHVLNGTFINNENLKNLELTLDDNKILDETTGDFINLRSIQPGIHHSRTQMMRKYYSYSFSLEPEKWYSTGTVNFSHVKDQLLKLRLNADDGSASYSAQYTRERLLKVYALSYNILRIENGTTKLLFN